MHSERQRRIVARLKPSQDKLRCACSSLRVPKPINSNEWLRRSKFKAPGQLVVSCITALISQVVGFDGARWCRSRASMSISLRLWLPCRGRRCPAQVAMHLRVRALQVLIEFFLLVIAQDFAD